MYGEQWDVWHCNISITWKVLLIIHTYIQPLAYILNYSVLPRCPGTVGQSLLQHLWKGTIKKREYVICVTADIFHYFIVTGEFSTFLF